MADPITRERKEDVKPPAQPPMRVPMTVKGLGEHGDAQAWTSVPTTMRERAERARFHETAILVDGICDRLDSLERHLPAQHAKVYVFARLLSKRIWEWGDISPDGFVLATDFLAFDLAGGAYERAGELKSSGLMDQSPQQFNEIVTSVTDAACPPGFAERVIRMRIPFTEPEYKR